MVPARPQHFATPCADQAARTRGERAHNDGRHDPADNARPGDPLSPGRGFDPLANGRYAPRRCVVARRRSADLCAGARRPGRRSGRALCVRPERPFEDARGGSPNGRALDRGPSVEDAISLAAQAMIATWGRRLTTWGLPVPHRGLHAILPTFPVAGGRSCRQRRTHWVSSGNDGRVCRCLREGVP
jgi:hypothetical protein